jgi:hypothetical protein
MFRKLTMLIAMLAIASLLLAPGGAAAQAPQPTGKELPGIRQTAPAESMNTPERNPWQGAPADRLAGMPQENQPQVVSVGSARAQLAPQASGGPDLFGYTYVDTPYYWVDASVVGTDTGMSNSSSATLALPFTFNFYEGAYSQVKIFSSGFMSFNLSDYNNNTQSVLPNPSAPNAVIEPYGLYFNLATSGPTNRVYTASGGAAPNRYFVVEWYGVHDGAGNIITFETILYESGHIIFNYNQSPYTNSYYCAAAGIEDSYGQDGLQTRAGCMLPPASSTAIIIIRPGDDRRVRLYPDATGGFGAAGQTASHSLVIRNTGALGNDTFDLSASGSWPAAFYAADGVTPLVDSGGSPLPDTGPLAPGQTLEVVVKVSLPSGALSDAHDTTTFTATSAANPARHDSSILQTAVPGRFASVFKTGWVPGTQMMLNQENNVRTIAATDTYGYDPMIAELPGGGFLTAWDQGRCLDSGSCSMYVSEIYYSVTNAAGERILGPMKMEDLSTATQETSEYPKALAIAPNGRAALMYTKEVITNQNTYTYTTALFMALIDPASGQPITPPISLDAGGSTVYFSGLSIAATTENRFVAGWSPVFSALYTSNVYYQVFDTAGAPTSPKIKMTEDTTSYDDGYFLYDIIPYNGSQALILYESMAYGNGFMGTVINGAGGWLRTAVPLGLFGSNMDAAQLSDGRIGVSLMSSNGYTMYSGEQPWQAEFWNNESLSGSPALTRTDPAVDFNWGTAAPGAGVNADHFSARWTGIATLPAGNYRFNSNSDDGGRVYVDNVLVLDNWSVCCGYYSTTLTLAAGPHSLRYEMHEVTGSATARFYWYRTDYNSGVAYQALNPDLSLRGSAVYLPPAGGGSTYYSTYPTIIPERNGRAIITYTGTAISDFYQLYYALVGANDQLVTPPMIFASDKIAGNSYISMNTNREGYATTTFTLPLFKISLPLVIL